MNRLTPEDRDVLQPNESDRRRLRRLGITQLDVVITNASGQVFGVCKNNGDFHVGFTMATVKPANDLEDFWRAKWHIRNRSINKPDT
jgi:hypothetical protein